MLKFEETDTHKKINLFGIKLKIKKPSSNKNFLFHLEKKGGVRKPLKKQIKGLSIEIVGKNNIIEIEKPIHFENSKILIHGNNNHIKIEQTKHVFKNLTIRMTQNNENRFLHIKKNCSCLETKINCWHEKAKIIIGEDCMMSWGVSINSSDAHTITQKGSNVPINNGGYCIIGNHVWLAQNSHICKNVEIGDNNVVGASSLVTKSFKENNVIIAGNPAKIIKQNIDWKRDFN